MTYLSTVELLCLKCERLEIKNLFWKQPSYLEDKRLMRK